MKEEYKFPEKWLLKFDKDNETIIKDWIINVKNTNQKPMEVDYVDQTGWIWGERHIIGWKHEKIDVEKFKHFVLHESIISQIDWYDNLLILLKKLNIQ